MWCCWAECACTSALLGGRRIWLLKQHSCSAPRACICQGASLPGKFQSKSCLPGKCLYSIWDWINCILLLLLSQHAPVPGALKRPQVWAAARNLPQHSHWQDTQADLPLRHLSVYLSPSRYASHDSFPTSQMGDVVPASCGKETLKWSQWQRVVLPRLWPGETEQGFSTTSQTSPHHRLVPSQPLLHISLTLPS